MVFRIVAATLLTAGLLTAQDSAEEYRVLATQRVSTMEKEMNEAADAGFRFFSFMGGKTTAIDDEIVAIMARSAKSARPGPYRYKLLATTRTGTMEKELQEAGQGGFIFRDQTRTASSGGEILAVLERDPSGTPREYKLLATLRTSTLEKELQDAAKEGFTLDGFTVGSDGWGSREMVAIMSKPMMPANP